MSFKLFARAPPARRKGKGTRSVANPCFATPRRRRGGILPSYLLTTFLISDKEKGAAQGRLPEPEAKQRTNKCQPIQILLCAPRASVIRMDFLDLTIADAGITLDLDKDWHPDLYENRDTSIRMVFCFKHV